MEMIIRETNRAVELSLIDNSGADNVIDFLATHWAFLNKEVAWDENSEVYTIRDEEAFKFWEKIVDDQRGLDVRLVEMGGDYGIDMVYECLSGIDVDIEDFAQVANKRLDEFISEIARD